MKQQKSLFEHFGKDDLKRRYGRTEYGGIGTKGRRKLERPLATNKWIHLVLKSDKAVGKLSFLLPKNRKVVENLLKAKARKFSVRIADLANVGNHLHLKVKIKSRPEFQNFLKAITTQIAKQITGAKKGNPFGRFWQGLAYTRVLTSALEELRLKGYFEANRIEGRTSPKVREMYLKAFSQWVREERGSTA